MIKLSPHAAEIERLEREADRERLLAMPYELVGRHRGPSREMTVKHVESEAPKRRGNVRTVDGVSKTMSQWAEELGINRNALSQRISTAGSLEAVVRRARLLPVLKAGKSPMFVEHRGERRTLKEWSAITGLNGGTIDSRLRGGWSVESALTTPAGRKKKAPGAVSSFKQVLGTGLGPSAFDSSEMVFHEDTEDADYIC